MPSLASRRYLNGSDHEEHETHEEKQGLRVLRGRFLGELETPGPSNDSNNEEQHDRSDERDEDDTAQSTEWRMDIECAEQPATDECPAYSDDHVADQSESCAPHYERREQSCNESDDQPGEEIHFVHPYD